MELEWSEGVVTKVDEFGEWILFESFIRVNLPE